MHLVSIQTGKLEERVSHVRDGQDRRWTSAIFKSPVTRPLRLDWTQLEGDGQADLMNHGGPDKAVNCYCVEHYPNWRKKLAMGDSVFGYGAFGENFTLSDMTEDAVCVGDIYQVGGVQVQISQPRVPCYKLGRRWNLATLPADVVASGKTGYYLRVLEPGTVAAGDSVTLVARPEPEWTVARLNDAYYNRRIGLELALILSDLPTLAEAWRTVFRKRAVALSE